MIERRTKRSIHRGEALQYLIEIVADRGGLPAVVLVDDDNRIVAGMGMPTEVTSLVRTARDVARKSASAADVEASIPGRDVTARAITTPDGSMYLGAIGNGMAGVGGAVSAIRRILVETGHAPAPGRNGL